MWILKKKRICLPMQEMWVQSLCPEDPLEKETATHSSFLAWEIPRTEEPGRLQPMGLQRIEHDLATEQKQVPFSYHRVITVICVRKYLLGIFVLDKVLFIKNILNSLKHCAKMFLCLVEA